MMSKLERFKDWAVVHGQWLSLALALAFIGAFVGLSAWPQPEPQTAVFEDMPLERKYVVYARVGAAYQTLKPEDDVHPATLDDLWARRLRKAVGEVAAAEALPVGVVYAIVSEGVRSDWPVRLGTALPSSVTSLVERAQQ